MDPLHYGSSSLPHSENVKFQSGKPVVNKLFSLVDNNQPINDIIMGSPDIVDHFKKLFPQVVESNFTGELDKKDYGIWSPGMFD